MKIIIAFSAIFIATAMAQMIPPEQIAVVMRFHKECQEKSGISSSLATGVVAGKFPDDPVLKTHLLCMNQKLGFQDEEGNLQTEQILTTLKTALPPSADVQAFVDDCAVQKDTPEDTAIEVGRCLYEKVKGKKGVK